MSSTNRLPHLLMEVINMKNKHLSFDERFIIQEQLNKGVSVHSIAQKLGRPDSSIVREIKRNRYLSNPPHKEACEYYVDCTCVTNARRVLRYS